MGDNGPSCDEAEAFLEPINDHFDLVHQSESAAGTFITYLAWISFVCLPLSFSVNSVVNFY